MQTGSSARDKSSGRADATVARMVGELLAALERGTVPGAVDPSATPFGRVPVPLAGLLIAKWVGHYVSECEAVAARLCGLANELVREAVLRHAFAGGILPTEETLGAADAN